jgi:hypothetical protein
MSLGYTLAVVLRRDDCAVHDSIAAVDRLALLGDCRDHHVSGTGRLH